MFQYFLRIIVWLVWYIKHTVNYEDQRHRVKIDLRRTDGNPPNSSYIIIAKGNGVMATFRQMQLNGQHKNGIYCFETVSDVVLPFEISTLTLQRLDNDEDPQWFVRWIEIDDEKHHRFPFNKWINPNSSITSRTDTLLPQDEANTYWSDIRGFHLAKKRLKYGFELYRDNTSVPVKISTIPKEEKFSLYHSMIYLVIPTIKMYFSKIIIKRRHWLPERWSSFALMEKAYTLYFKKPKGIENWKTDLMFAHQRLNHCNWSSIQLVKNRDDIANFLVIHGVDNAIDSNEVDELIEQKRLFFTDLNLPVKLAIPSPVVLFQQTDTTGLLPIAINLRISDGTNFTSNPVFYRNDDHTIWMLAKMWSNVADSSVHLGVLHLGLTHLFMEGVDICFQRNLSTRHPIYKLLAPHFYLNLAINDLARTRLLGPGAYIDKTLKIKTEGVLCLLGQKLANWRMDIDGTLPKDLERRGLYDPVTRKITIPGFFYAEDGLLLYDALHNYVTQYVTHYYSGVDDNDTKNRLLEDNEIQSFYRELVTPREHGGIGINGVPNTNDRFEEIQQLTDTLTSILYICTVMHAATNFPQYDEYGFPPNYTTFLHNAPPEKDWGRVDENFLLSCLPTVEQTFDIMSIFTILSQQTTKQLGQFEVQYIEDPDAVEILNSFRTRLHQIEMIVTARNNKIVEANAKIKSRGNEEIIQYPYYRLLPANIPNSIAI